MLKNKILPTVTLTSICIIVALLLSAVNLFTAPVIEQAQEDNTNDALKVVYPEGEDFEPIDLSGHELPTAVTEGYKANDGGYVFKLSVVGYKDGLVIMCGVSADGKITGSKYIESQETNGAENKLDGAYNGQSLAGLKIELIGGSTRTSEGYHSAIEAALQAFAILNGESVDLRTPEEILNDNCNTALGTKELTFTKWFAVDEIAVDAIYYSEESKGAVILIGGEYIGVGEDGRVKNGALSESKKAKAESSFEIYKSAELTEVSLPKNTPDTVKKLYITAKGNYVFELEGKGYGIKGTKYNSGLPIEIRLALTPEGKIISTLTVSQSESPQSGGKCQTPEFYEQFNGKTEQNYADVENISGATVTSEGYKEAIGDAFATLKLFKGGKTA